MTDGQAAEIVYAAFAAAWAASTWAALPYGRDGVPFTPVVGVAHAAIAVRNINTTQVTMGSAGNRKFDTRRLFMVDCAAPGGAGRETADAMAEMVKNAFQGKLLPGSGSQVICEVAQRNEIGDDGSFYRIMVSIPFRYEESM